MSYHIPIDNYAYISGLKDWNADYKVCFSLAALLTVIAADVPLLSAVTLLYMGGVSCLAGRVKVKDYLRLLMLPAAFILMSGAAILIQFGSGDTSLLCIPAFATNLYVTAEGFTRFVSLSLKALGAVSCLYFLALSTPMGEIIRFLYRLPIPHILLELMHFIYRYIFILLEVHQRQREAVKSRLGYLEGRNALRVFGAEMAHLFILSMKKAGDYYDALESRGYDEGCLFFEEKRKCCIGQWIGGLLYAGLAALSIAAAMKGAWR